MSEYEPARAGALFEHCNPIREHRVGLRGVFWYDVRGLKPGDFYVKSIVSSVGLNEDLEPPRSGAHHLLPTMPSLRP